VTDEAFNEAARLKNLINMYGDLVDALEGNTLRTGIHFMQTDPRFKDVTEEDLEDLKNDLMASVLAKKAIAEEAFSDLGASLS
jgi:hypothetical protein